MTAVLTPENWLAAADRFFSDSEPLWERVSHDVDVEHRTTGPIYRSKASGIAVGVIFDGRDTTHFTSYLDGKRFACGTSGAWASCLEAFTHVGIAPADGDVDLLKCAMTADAYEARE